MKTRISVLIIVVLCAVALFALTGAANSQGVSQPEYRCNLAAQFGVWVYNEQPIERMSEYDYFAFCEGA